MSQLIARCRPAFTRGVDIDMAGDLPGPQISGNDEVPSSVWDADRAGELTAGRKLLSQCRRAQGRIGQLLAG